MLYKYLSLDSLSVESILVQHKVYFASVLNLNDPFEGLPTYRKPSRDEVKQHLLRRGAKRKNINKLLPRAITDIEHNMRLMRSYDQSIAEQTGIFCVTPHRDNLLMWSHYADSHKGICIGLDIKQPHDIEFGVGYNVEYETDYPEICMLQRDLQMAAQKSGHTLITDDELEDLATKQFYTKSKEWQYEDELRFIRPKLNGGVGLMSFNPLQIKEVIIGCRVSKEKRKEIVEIVSKHCQTAAIYDASISKHKYELTFKQAFEVAPVC